MEKHFITALLVLMLLAPQTGLEAKSRHHGVKGDYDAEDRDHEDKKRYHKAKKRHHKSKKHHHSSRKFFRFARGTKAELELLKQAISEMNAKMEAPEPQGDLVAELAAQLVAMQTAINDNDNTSAIGANTSGITMALEETMVNAVDIDGLNTAVTDLGTRLDALVLRVDNHESRLLILEQDTPPAVEPDLVFTGTFIQGGVPAPSIGEDWLDFRSKATGLFASIEISSSNGGIAICSDPGAAEIIAKELNSHVPTPGSLTPIACQGKIWNVGNCGGAVELNASLSSGACLCDQGATVRPRIGNISWGGVGSDFGGPVGGPPTASCNSGAPSQTLTVTLTR